MRGYSDRIHHALSFAAKHHDQQVRSGTRAPYFTRPANMGIILTRYGCDDATVMAGILHDVVEDTLRSGHDIAMRTDRVTAKFGGEVVDLALAIVPRRSNDDGVEFAPEERREDLLDRLGVAPPRALWVCAARTLHDAATLLANLRRTVDSAVVWDQQAGRGEALSWYRRIADRLHNVGFTGPIMAELEEIVAALETWKD